ncbi:MAG: OmpA family protein [Pseudomonadota bacterium]
MSRFALLLAGCLLCLPAAADDDPVRTWPSPGLELKLQRGELKLRGHVVSTAHLVELGRAAGDQRLTTTDTYRHVLLPDHWREASALLVSLLAGLHSGDAAMTRDEISLRGTLTTREEFRRLVAQLRDSVPPETSILVDTWDAPHAACDTLLGALLDGSFRLRAGQVDVSGEHFPRLNRIADALQRCREVRLRVSGHTDNSGDADDNARLSEQRARAYTEYLQQQGVEAERLVWEGRGSAEPVGNNRSAAGRNRNRRVAIEIY